MCIDLVWNVIRCQTEKIRQKCCCTAGDASEELERAGRERSERSAYGHVVS